MRGAGAPSLSGEWMPRVVTQDGLVGLQRLRGLVQFLVCCALSKQQQGEELEVTGVASLQRKGTRLLGEIEGMVWPPNLKLDDGEGVDQIESLRVLGEGLHQRPAGLLEIISTHGL